MAKALDLPLVGGAQGLHVKLAGGVLHALGGHGEGLQLRIVGGGGDAGPGGAGVGDDGDGQRRPLHRVRAGPQLVEEHQGPAVRLLQYTDDVGHVCREGGQALFDALFVADVREHPVIDADGTARGGGDLEAALGHQGEKAQGFERHRLAAGVGAGDYQGVKPAA